MSLELYELAKNATVLAILWILWIALTLNIYYEEIKLQIST